MQWLNFFKFKSNGIIISFTQTEPVAGEIIPKFSFEVEGDKELTQKLLSLVKTKKVKKEAIHLCAEALFKIIEGNKTPEIGKINISSTVTSKGPEEERYYKINLIHRRGLLSKSFVLTGAASFGTLGDWEDIFASYLQESYADFLKQFGVEIPKELLNDNNSFEFSDALEKFKSNFNFS